MQDLADLADREIACRASSRMAISVEGSGRPIVPVNSLAVNLLAVATGEVSESP